MMTLFKSLVLSRLDYGSQLWSPTKIHQIIVIVKQPEEETITETFHVIHNWPPPNNDMPDKITSMVHLFADDTKISLRLTNQNQTSNLQNDIDRLDEWSDRWKLRFNVAKCKTMHIGYHNDKHIYQMGSGRSRMDLNQVTSEKDLGITFQDDLQFTKHLADKVKKANSIRACQI